MLPDYMTINKGFIKKKKKIIIIIIIIVYVLVTQAKSE